MIPQQGLASLPQAQQGPMPGQAPMQQMPGMMPQQGAPTPAAMVGPLTQMHMQQLVQLMLNPRPDGPPLYAVLSALSEKQKAAKTAQAMQGQQAMAQNAQMQQQPPVAAQVVQAAEQMAPQGYASGGAVAFATGTGPDGLPQQGAQEDISDDESLPLMERIRRSQKRAELSRQQGIGRSFAERFPREADIPAADTGDELARLLRRAPPPTAAAAAPMAPAIGRSLSAPPAGPRMQAAAPAPAPIMGLPSLSPERQAEIKADQERAEALARSREAAARQMGTVSPEVLASRERLQQILGSAYDPQKRAIEEAKAAQAQGLRGSAEALGRMAAAASRGKRVGQVLGEAAGAGAEFMGEQRRRIEALQDRYNALKSQLDITMAQAQHADVVGDDKLKRDALMKAEDIKAELFNTQRGIRKEAVGEQVQQASGIAALRNAASSETQARASMIQAGKPPGEIALMQWLQDPKNRKMYEDIQSSKRDEDRMVKLYEIYSKNKLMLGNPTFEEFVAGFKAASPGAASGAAPGRQLKYNPATGKIE